MDIPPASITCTSFEPLFNFYVFCHNLKYTPRCNDIIGCFSAVFPVSRLSRAMRPNNHGDIYPAAANRKQNLLKLSLIRQSDKSFCFYPSQLRPSFSNLILFPTASAGNTGSCWISCLWKELNDPEFICTSSIFLKRSACVIIAGVSRIIQNEGDFS